MVLLQLSIADSHVRMMCAYVNKLVREFECWRFEAHVTTGRRGQHEAKVDVNKVTTRVEQNVAVVSENKTTSGPPPKFYSNAVGWLKLADHTPVFDLQEVADETVSGQTADEVPLSF